MTDYAIYMLDADGLVSSWNLGAQRFKGYTAEEIIGQHFSKFYTQADRDDGLPARALETARREGKFEGKGWRHRKDGTRFWAHVVIDPMRDESGILVGYAKITRDLTEHKEAEDALKRSQEQFRLLVNGVTDYAIYMLDKDGRVTSWNTGAQRIKGYREEEVLGQHFSKFYRPEDRRNNDPERTLEIAAREGRFESEGWRVRKDGSHFWANVVVDPIRDEKGVIIGFAKVTRDVTERRDTLEALGRARESLFQSQKLEAIGQLTGGVAHDFNNLLMVILSSLELVRRRIGNDPKVEKLLQNAIQGTKRGVSLTQRMLAFARKQELSPVAVDLADLVNGMSDLLQRSLGPSIRLHFRLPLQLQCVRVDPNQLELALLNLAVNARDAMPDGGDLTVWAKKETVPKADLKLRPGGYIRVGVSDSGDGMDEATLARATEPFFTTKGVGKGTGLGLSMVEGLASQSGGKLELTSRKDEGTTAELWLPVTDPTVAEGDDTGHGAATSRDSTPLTILAVDDDNLVLTSTTAMLEELGYKTLGAESAQKAIEVLQQEPGVQLVLTDHAMPHMTGVELVHILRKTYPRLGLILASGYAQSEAKLPPNVVRLAKPYEEHGLVRAIAASTGALGATAV